jgi:hypothetical protein
MSLQIVNEGVHYELIPADEDNVQAWDVRFLEGRFTETVIRFGNISFEDDCLKFNFVIQSTPDSSLDVDDVDLQNFAADVLESILESAASDGSLIYGDDDNNED